LPRRELKIDWEVARDILRYFMRNPQGGDTLEGLVRWRLLDETIYRSLEEIKSVVDWLVTEEFLVREMTSPSKAFFCLNRKKQNEIERFLEQAERPEVKPEPG